MPATPRRPRQRLHFLVELRASDDEWDTLAHVGGRARSAAVTLRGEGVDVRFVRSVYAPESDRLFLVYQAASEEVALLAATRAQLRPTRVSSAVDGDAGRHDHGGGR